MMDVLFFWKSWMNFFSDFFGNKGLIERQRNSKTLIFPFAYTKRPYHTTGQLVAGV